MVLVSTRKSTTTATATVLMMQTVTALDELEVAGCTNIDACNYDELATDDDGSCIWSAIRMTTVMN